MARSKYTWIVLYDDLSCDFINAQTISQILKCDKLSQDIDNIIQINRIDFAYEGTENIIDIPFRD